jgi:hypothetical protein
VALCDGDKQLLLETAYRAIDFGLTHRRELDLPEAEYPERLRAAAATFVTLRHRGRLQGCVGTTRALRPLIRDVAHNAYHAAFHDHRFPVLVREQLGALEVHISLLSPLERLSVVSEEDLLRQLRRGVDGLVLEEADYRATFLPAMWEQLRDPLEFVRQLKEKAGLPGDYWSPGLSAFRYTAETIP